MDLSIFRNILSGLLLCLIAGCIFHRTPTYKITFTNYNNDFDFICKDKFHIHIKDGSQLDIVSYTDTIDWACVDTTKVDEANLTDKPTLKKYSDGIIHITYIKEGVVKSHEFNSLLNIFKNCLILTIKAQRIGWAKDSPRQLKLLSLYFQLPTVSSTDLNKLKTLYPNVGMLKIETNGFKWSEPVITNDSITRLSIEDSTFNVYDLEHIHKAFPNIYSRGGIDYRVFGLPGLQIWTHSLPIESSAIQLSKIKSLGYSCNAGEGAKKISFTNNNFTYLLNIFPSLNYLVLSSDTITLVNKTAISDSLKKLTLRANYITTRANAFLGFKNLKAIDISFEHKYSPDIEIPLGINELTVSGHDSTYPDFLFDSPSSLSQITVNDDSIKHIDTRFLKLRNLTCLVLVDTKFGQMVTDGDKNTLKELQYMERKMPHCNILAKAIRPLLL
jgi:hypothetical protein